MFDEGQAEGYKKQAEVSRRKVLEGVNSTITGTTSISGTPETDSQAGEPVALQYFHNDWTTIKDDLDRVAEWGFDAIWIQQPAEAKLTKEEDQKDEDDDGVGEPTLGYQPIDVTNFDSEMGTESELQTLIDTAHDNGVDVIVDTVTNHTANTNDYTLLEQFDQSHFHNNGEIPQWAYTFEEDNPDCYEGGDTSGTPKDPYEYECDPYLVENAALLGLNDLDHDQQYVRDVLKNYMDKIASLGADGYRFDAAKHMAESFFANYLNQWAENNGMFRVGEVYDGNPRYLRGYANAGPGMHVFDFQLFYTIQDVFSGGDMTRLDGAGLIATDPYKSMPFVENHDVTAPSQYKLAHAFLLSSEGYPMLYNPLPKDWLLKQDDIKNMVWVKRNLAGGNTLWRYTDSDLAIYERDSHLLVGLNNSGTERSEWVDTSWADTELKDYAGNEGNATSASDGRVQITVPAEGWVFYAPATQDITVDAAGETGIQRGGTAQISISAEQVDQIEIDKLWTDWTLDTENPDGGTVTDAIADAGTVTIDYSDTQSSVAPSITVSLPQRYAGGEYRLTITATNDDGYTDETTATISIA